MSPLSQLCVLFLCHPAKFDLLLFVPTVLVEVMQAKLFEIQMQSSKHKQQAQVSWKKQHKEKEEKKKRRSQILQTQRK